MVCINLYIRFFCYPDFTLTGPPTELGPDPTLISTSPSTEQVTDFTTLESFAQTSTVTTDPTTIPRYMPLAVAAYLCTILPILEVPVLQL